MSTDINYKIHHYCCDHVNDASWGCVWRNIQTMMDSFKLPVPSMKDLAIFFEKEEYFSKITKGDKDIALTTLWLEPYEAGKYFEHLGFKVCNILWIKSDEGMANIMNTPLDVYLDNPELSIYNPSRKSDFTNIIVNYLKNYNHPILIDNGTFSYLIGSYLIVDNKLSIIRIDPHTNELKDTISVRELDKLLDAQMWMVMFVMPKKK